MGNDSYSNNTSSFQEDPFFTFSTVFKIILCVIGLLGNGLVMYVIMRYPKLHNAPNLYILNLSLAQFLYYVREVIQVAFMVIGPWTFGVAMCKVYRFVWAVSILAGSAFLAILSVERHQAVVNPVRSWLDHMAQERRVAFRNACIVWGIVAFLCVPHLVFASVTNVGAMIDCYYVAVGSMDAHTFNTIRIFYSVGLGFVVPLIIMVPHYVLLIVKLREVRAGNRDGGSNALGRVSRLVVVLVTVFVVFNLPGHVVNILTSVFGSVNLSTSTQWFTYALQDVSPCLNPVLCAVVPENFRSAVFKTLCTWPFRPKNHPRSSVAVTTPVDCEPRAPPSVSHETTL
ncbi:somatostatin receptor type 2-like [Branchiostoma floridae]|uniref:Somatostatin receptor type 2-like n=1 Tax=Branchiostoma floridae TaxID=7739 RepID=A0A9J7HS62_BRAFL|nr:somatostatin receptor type 2-like [Branchiostoma floridae]XP_035663432.1 somatostatin receptor type 2-like [Branchiostoma floridae]